MKIHCPHCGQPYEVDVHYIGQAMKCQSCDHEFYIENPNLFPCPDCSALISRQAETCPHCGVLLSATEEEQVIISCRPSAIDYLFWIILGVITIPVYGIGLLFLLYVLISIYSVSYQITTLRIVVQRGLFSNSQSEIWIKDIRGLFLQQGAWQCVVGTGNIKIGTAATAGIEIWITSISNPQEVIERINMLRNQKGMTTGSSYSSKDNLILAGWILIFIAVPLQIFFMVVGLAFSVVGFIFTAPIYLVAFIIAIIALAKKNGIKRPLILLASVFLSWLVPIIVTTIIGAMENMEETTTTEKNKRSVMEETTTTKKNKRNVVANEELDDGKPADSIQYVAPKILGAFGLTFGGIVNPNDVYDSKKLDNGHIVYAVNAPMPYRYFQQVWVGVGPYNEIFLIVGIAQFDSASKADAEMEVLKTAIEQKYKVNGVKDIFGEDYSFDFGSAEVTLSRPSFEVFTYQLLIFYTDKKLEKQVEQYRINMEINNSNNSAI